MNKKWLGILAMASAALTTLAAGISNTASVWWLYQPKVPKSIKK